jgi:hypothetical protein
VHGKAVAGAGVQQAVALARQLVAPAMRCLSFNQTVPGCAKQFALWLSAGPAAPPYQPSFWEGGAAGPAAITP